MKNKIDIIYLFSLAFFLLYALIPLISDAVYYVSGAFLTVYLLVNRKHVELNYLRWILSFSLFFIISIMWALKINVALWAIVQLLMCLILSLSTSAYVQEYKKIKIVLLVYFLMTLIMMFYAIAANGLDTEGERFGEAMNKGNDEPIWNENSMGMSICFALFAGYILFWRGKKRFLKILFLMISLLMIFVVLLTGSRKTIVILVLPFVFFLLKKREKYLLPTLCVIIGVVVLGFVLIMKVPALYDTIGIRLVETSNIISGDTDGSEDISRLILIQLGMGWFAERPILGYGINNFRVLSDNTYWYAGKNFYAHNNYVELLVDVGIIGTIIYYIGYIYIIRRSFNKESYSLNWCFVVILILLFRDFAMVSYYEPTNHLIIALLFSIIRLNRKKISTC